MAHVQTKYSLKSSFAPKHKILHHLGLTEKGFPVQPLMVDLEAQDTPSPQLPRRSNTKRFQTRFKFCKIDLKSLEYLQLNLVLIMELSPAGNL